MEQHDEQEHDVYGGEIPDEMDADIDVDEHEHEHEHDQDHEHEHDADNENEEDPNANSKVFSLVVFVSVYVLCFGGFWLIFVYNFNFF